MLTYGKQVGAFAYGGGINIHGWADYWRKRGFVVVFHAGYASIHEQAK